MIHSSSAGNASDLTWFKSSYSSSGDGNDCVEVALDWWKSSYSSSSEIDSCIEIARTPATIHIRDSKQTHGPRLTLTPAAWGVFVGYAQN
ncbi:DUF397 domain-containing protein [Streptomyces sp. NPDC088789]|uniref:DUF397 domain-containing protein n=1 Tax=Streptomyces sp. NPDC088789 TaxID=3365899 RepID=UPI00380B559B